VLQRVANHSFVPQIRLRNVRLQIATNYLERRQCGCFGLLHRFAPLLPLLGVQAIAGGYPPSGRDDRTFCVFGSPRQLGMSALERTQNTDDYCHCRAAKRRPDHCD
jgi:hypothetical protein